MLERWRLALEGAGQIVLLHADAGLGKSRLVGALADRTAADGRAFLLCRCSPRRRHTAFAPMLDLLRRMEAEDAGHGVQGPAGDADEEERVRATLVARLTALLQVPRPVRPTSLHLNPEGQAKKTLEALAGLFLDSAKRHPVLLVIEDLDWVDPSTLALLSMLVHRRPNVRLMVVLTFGSRFEPPWGHRAHVTALELPRLSREQAEAMLARLAGDHEIEREVRRKIVALADGVPLFVEELVRLAKELGAAEGDSAADRATSLPMTLKLWLDARLKPLGAARGVAQLAAALGGELSYELLRSVSELDEHDLKRHLDRLVAANILRRIGSPPWVEYAFHHAAIGEAIHQTLREAPRREAHRRIAEILRQTFPEIAEQEPELMAYHWGEAGMLEEAVAAWRAAAEQAVRSSANLEAEGRARRGLELVESLAGSDAALALEIGLRIDLGAAVGTAKGYAAPEAQASYDRALELVRRAPRSPELFPAMQELASYYLSRGQLDTALETARTAQELVAGADRPEAQPQAWRTLGFAQLLHGDFAGAGDSLEKGLAPYAVHRSLLHATPPALGVPLAETLSHLSLVRWFLGHPAQALKHATDSLTLARRSGDPFARVFTIYRASYLHVFRREPVATQELAHELVELANRHGFLFFIAAGMFLEGQALTAQGRAAEGLQMMSGGLDGVWASGMEVGRPRNLALLAEACGRSQLVEQGLSLVKEGLAAVEITGEAHYESELHRIQGELQRLAGESEKDVEASFSEALGLARRQGSLALELRAAISLARVWRDREQGREARELLESAYGKFAEGFDTVDLTEAKELIEELG